MKARVIGNEKLVRDHQNLAILNTDRSAVKAHTSKMAQLKRIREQEEELNKLRDEVAEIRTMMSQYLKSNH